MKNKLISMVPVGALLALVVLAVAGCGGGSSEIPYPDHYCIPKTEDAEAESSGKEGEEEQPVEVEASVEDSAAETTKKKTIRYFFDTSGSSIQGYSGVIKINAAAGKSSAGYENRQYYGINANRQLTEVEEERAVSGTYGNGAPIDLLRNLPVVPEGVNVITTDLQSEVNCTELGRWLIDTGSTGYSFYVFRMPYDGALSFKTYTSNSIKEKVSVFGSSFKDKEFLMIVFGDDELVREYDSCFQKKLGTEVKYDMCHAFLRSGKEHQDSFLNLRSSKCFDSNVANIEYENTNFVYGLSLVDTETTEFTCENTFVYKKSRYSANKAKNAVKAILYAVPDPGVEIPAVENVKVVSVQEYDKEKEAYKESKADFTVSAIPFLEGLPSACDPDPKKNEVLEKSLGGDIVAAGPVFAVTVENKNLPKGLYAVEVQITFEAEGEAVDLQNFAASHSSGLEEYSTALVSECEARVSSSEFDYTGNGSDSPFCKLLEFERLMDELMAAGATELKNEMIQIRLIIDNR